MSRQAEVAIDQLVFRKTHEHTGRHISIMPLNSSMLHLSYGRIILSAAKPAESFSTGDRETGLICLSGQAEIKVDGEERSLEEYDAIYIPRDSSVEVTTGSKTDIAEFSAEVAKRYPLQLVRFSQVTGDPGLRFTTGGAGSSRQLHMLLAKNVQAGRLVAGFTCSDPGNWTSWPPHEHAKMLEEMYVYFNMPDPAFGIQLVYNNTEYPELVTVVRIDSWPSYLFSLGDGGPSRGRRPTVWCGQRTTRIRPGIFGTRSGPEKIIHHRLHGP
jgi:5-deoxy-glucuronate isomerase